MSTPAALQASRLTSPGTILAYASRSNLAVALAAPILWLKKQTGSHEAPMQAIWFVLWLGPISYIFLVREKYAPREAIL